MAEGAGLENRYTGNGIEGSNPSLSAGLPNRAPLPAGVGARCTMAGGLTPNQTR